MAKRRGLESGGQRMIEDYMIEALMEKQGRRRQEGR